MGGGSFGPSSSLIGTLNQQRQSDAVVQFLRALAASHMLANVGDFHWTFHLLFEKQEEERSGPLFTTASAVSDCCPA